jgi:hypothetical protein
MVPCLKTVVLYESRELSWTHFHLFLVVVGVFLVSVTLLLMCLPTGGPDFMIPSKHTDLLDTGESRY